MTRYFWVFFISFWGFFSTSFAHHQAVSPRILINGEVICDANSGEIAPYLEGKEVMADLETILSKLDYTFTYNTQIGIVIAMRQAGNHFGKTILTFNPYKDYLKGENEMTYALAKPLKRKGKRLFVPAKLVLELGGCTKVEWDKDYQSLQAYYYEKLEYGIYFYGEQTSNDSVVSCQKYLPSQKNAFFDPNKPTIIYTHGWQLNNLTVGGREGFKLVDKNKDIYTHNFWLNKGWNVGIFHWVQLADDGGVPPPREPEAKIYDVNNTLAGMRWKRADGTLVTEENFLPKKSVMQLYAEAYTQVFGKDYKGNEIRLVGNSLGGNLTMALLMELHQQNISPKPQRITLIDPYWSFNLTKSQVNFPYQYNNAYDLTTDAAKIYNEKYGAAIEYIRTSIAGTIGTNDSLIAQTAFTHYGTDYTFDPLKKHTVPVRQYFWSINFPAPKEVDYPNHQPTGKVATSAATPNQRIREMMNHQHFWNHLKGRNTLTPEDDEFEYRDGLY